jgi:hypothetical protein
MLTGIISAPNPYIIAMTLASQGLAVFPVRAKRPLTPRGVYSATSDLDLLARMDDQRASNRDILCCNLEMHFHRVI